MARSSVTPEGVYRTPGRVLDAVPPPLPSWRTLRAPFVAAASMVVALVLPVAIFNAVTAPSLSLPAETRFIPLVDQLQSAAMVLLPASLLLLVVVLVRRVAPSWRGMRLGSRVLYVAGLLVAQVLVAIGGEATIFCVRGGLHLFEPVLQSSSIGGDLRSAHIYREGLGCGYDVYVSEPFSITMKRGLHVGRKSCDEPLPTVRWNAAGTVDLVDRDGKPLESESTPPLFGWGGGC